MRLSALAPAEITPLRLIPITSPLDGVVREIVVKPNQIVKADEVLVVLDDTALRSRLSSPRARSTSRAPTCSAPPSSRSPTRPAASSCRC